ncbi:MULTISPECIES: M15 family metallopeptidase [Planococcus]|uniref:D-alanyl-D-alanine carboxypeptidase n=1 Tax=Planococcus faecalis TaxID=1598147 RepID=A0ABN4XEN5_9BACL|nr:MULTISPECIES: M15 family metallopeptidase [Planococcus]AQU78258.1 D-alanyl-D-alanine carboxypeptidase [Planococcus faecalis]MDJ0332826.1 M15 family metallopeptidase [Planococcus sp. S3-L1]OHX53836.1 D-alanyl-D-alanine carboxypeptidase [Planococcus faecalis]
MKFINRVNQKNKKFSIKWVVIGVSAIMAALAAVWLYMHDLDVEQSMKALTDAVSTEESAVETPKDEVAKPTEPEKPEEAPDATVYPEDIELPKAPTIINGVLLANKQHPLPETYAPGEVPEARSAFETMKAAAAEAGLNLHGFSTYRDFARQKQLYDSYVAKDGQQAADRYSARPGYSEHQTGLTFDIGEAGKEQHWASASFGDTEGGKWLASNAHQYGFILRYPEGSEHITGYMHESWHFRYVGKDIATEIYQQDITLEEYLGI